MNEKVIRYPILSLLSLKPEKLLKLAKQVLETTDKEDLTGEEITIELVSRKLGRRWYTTEKGASRNVKRVGQRIAQLLGTKSHAEANRADLGIGVRRKLKKNSYEPEYIRPLRFYLIGADYVRDVKRPEKPKRNIDYSMSWHNGNP